MAFAGEKFGVIHCGYADGLKNDDRFEAENTKHPKASAVGCGVACRLLGG